MYMCVCVDKRQGVGEKREREREGQTSSKLMCKTKSDSHTAQIFYISQHIFQISLTCGARPGKSYFPTQTVPGGKRD